MKQPQFPSYFADAETDYPLSKYVLFGVPYDLTSSFRYGAAKGPDAIRHASWNFETFNLLTQKDFSRLYVHDHGNLDDVSTVNPYEMIKNVTTFSSKIFQEQKIPVCLGGEHSISAGIISSVPSDTSVIIFDAHLDYREEYEDESWNHACTIRRIADMIEPENIYVLGVRSAEKTEYEKAKQDSLSFINSLTIMHKGISTVLQTIKENLDSQNIYLSIDIDVIDPGFAPGTGTPEPFGLHPLDILHSFDLFREQIIGFDVMEVNPLFDHGQTAMLAAKYVRYGIESLSQMKY